jgi:arylsulfatase A-like enzyme
MKTLSSCSPATMGLPTSVEQILSFSTAPNRLKVQYGRGKGFTYEGGIRIPLIVSWEGKIHPGSSSDLVSAFWDVLPTLADLTGTNVPSGTDGISFLPELLGKESQQQHEFLYWEVSILWRAAGSENGRLERN